MTDYMDGQQNGVILVDGVETDAVAYCREQEEKIRRYERPGSSWGFMYMISMLVIGVATMAFSTWLWANIYDWPEITRKLDRLAVLERQASAYQAMEDANIGVWCELAVHYDWLEEEDREQATLIIESRVHE